MTLAVGLLFTQVAFAQLPGIVILTDLDQPYNGTPRSATVTVLPPVSYIVTYDGSTTPPTDAGSYAVVATIDDPLWEGSATGTLKITKITLTATADDQSRLYGGADPTFTIGYSGFVNGETPLVIDTAPIGSPAANGASPVGNYAINVSGGNDNNYDFNYVAGTLKITQAPLIATANDDTREYGQPNPPFTITYSGFLNGDNAGADITAPIAGTLANASSSVGDYDITLSGGSATNYSLTLQKGTLTITKATPVITWGNPTAITYGTPLGPTQLNAISSAPGTFTYSPVSGTVLNAGVNQTLTANFTPSDPTNYNAVNGTTVQISVNKATPVVSWAPPAAITYGTALGAQLNATANVPGIFNYSPPAGTILNAGANQTLSVNFTPDDGANYNVVNGTTVLITVNKATPVITWATPDPIPYGTALSATQLDASSNVGGTFVYVPASGTVLNAGVNQSLTANFTPTDAANYNAVNGTSVLITVNKATPVITWGAPLPITYGTALSATQLNATASVPGLFNYVPASGAVLNAGVNQTLTVNFTPTDGTNYNVVNGTTVLITVNKATPVVSWVNPTSINYGTALGATQLNATATVAGTFTYLPPAGTILNAGANQTLTVNFAPTDGTNYNVVNGTTAQITVNKVTPVVTWANPAAITYGTPLSATQLNATATVAGSFSYAPGLGTILNAGANQALSVNFTPTDATNYNAVPGTQVLITVNKATPIITWANPAAISYGTPLSPTQLNASANVPGSFIYSPPSGTILNAGANQTLSADFTPASPDNYNAVDNTHVLITVNKAMPVITWATPSPITYGTPLSAAQLNATASVPGTFMYTPTIGTVLNAGVNQVLSVNFTPTDGANFDPVIGTQRQITVNKANPSVSWTTPGPIIYGTPLSATQLNATATVPGTFTYVPPAGTVLNTGVGQILSVNFTPTDATNYNVINGTTVLITVNKATPVVTWATPAPIHVGVALSATQLNATASVPGTFVYTPPIGTLLPAGDNQLLSVNFTPTDAANYNAVNNTTTTITVSDKETPVLTWGVIAAINYGTALSATQLNATANVPGTFVYTPAIGTLLNAGASQTLSVNFIPTDGVTYNSVSMNNTITVNKVTLTATASSTSRLYGASNPVFIITYAGFVNGENATVLDTAPTATSAAVAGSNAGTTYPIVPAGGVDGNYNITYVNGVLTINKAALTAKADDKSRSYGLANPAFTISYTGFVNGDDKTDITEPVIGTVATSASNVGAYPITLTGGAAVNYTITLQNGTLNINIAPLTVKADDKVKTYGQPNPPLTITYTGFLNGDNASSITPPTISTTAVTGSSAGSYPITLTGGSAVNYGLILQDGTLTVGKAALTAKADDKSKIYGQVVPPLTITYTGFVNGDDVLDITPPTIATAAMPGSNAGTYPITLSGGVATNYNLTLQNGTLTVSKATPVVTWANQAPITYGTPLGAGQLSATATVPGSFVYTPAAGTLLNAGANQVLSVNFIPTDLTNFNSVNGTTVLITVTKAVPVITWTTPAAINYGTALSVIQLNASANTAGTFVYSPPAGTILGAGPNQPLSVNFTPTDLTNYTPVIGTTVLITVNKSNPIITWANPAPITYGTAITGTQLNATANVPGTFTYSPVTGTILAAGPNQILSVNFVPTDAANYNPVNGTTVQITVNKATPVITWANPAPITYGTPLSATQLNASVGITGSFTYSPSIGTVLNAGANQPLSVNFTPTDVANYNPVIGTQVLITVNKAIPVITWPTPATISYGTPLSATQLNATATVPGAFTYTPPAGTILNTGVNQILSVNFTPTDAVNYSVVSGVTRLITVIKSTPIVMWSTPLPIKVGVPLGPTQLNATANVPGTFTYTPPSGTVLGAGANQVLSVNFAPTDAGNYNPVNNTQVQITVNLKDNPVITWADPAAITYGTPLGAGQLNATASVAGTFTYAPPAGTVLNAGTNQALTSTFTPTDAVNFNSIVTTVHITVNKAVLTATASSTSRVYGASNPVFTIVYSGFVNGDAAGVLDTAPTASCSAIVGSSAGSSFPIVPAGGTDNNYTFIYVNGTLTITKASLTAKADDKSRSYGLANPTFTISYSGFVNGDDPSDITAPAVSTTATLTSNVGTYPITLTGGSSSNYNFIFQPGTLTINIAPLTAKADNKTKIYGQANPPLTITYTGFLNNDSPSSITEPTLGTPATVLTGVGVYPITLTGGSALNYGLILQVGTLTIGKAALTAKADNKTKTYGQANPTNSITYTGFVNADSPASIVAPTITGPAATPASPVGTYPITLSGGTAANYNLTLQNGLLTITKAPLRIVVQNKSRGYSEQNPVLTFSYVMADFVNGDNAASITAPVATTVATTASPAGAYAITVTGTTLNYDFMVTDGVLTVNKAPLTAKAEDKSKVYGDANPALTVTYNGFVNGETLTEISELPTASTAASELSDAGNYPITVSGGLASNYQFVYVDGTLAVEKATLTATAKTLNRLFESPNPPLTILYTGFKNGDTPADIDTPPTATTTAVNGSPIGVYPIVLSGGQDNNYAFTLVPGTLSVISSFAPSITHFDIETKEDVKYVFDYEDFNEHFVGYAGDSIISIKIILAPVNGDLFWQGNKVTTGDQIAVVHGDLGGLNYTPTANFNGNDVLTWNVFDGTFTATADATIGITITPVNDPPVLTNIESEPILYGLADEATPVTKKVILNDIDDISMNSARIFFIEGYKSGDLLSWDKTTNPKITATFDAVRGELLLSGADSKSNYETALHNVLFSSPISGDTTLLNKKVGIVVNDSTNDSNIASRIIRITKVFPELSIVNAFTPNNDGFNDYWDFLNLDFYTEIKIAVFDQNGIRVYDCGNKDCKWDGKIKGKELPAGPYFYTIDLDGGKRTYRGTVTILK